MTRVRVEVRDALIAVAVAAILVITGLTGDRAPAAPAPLGLVLLAAGGLVLAVARRAPATVLVVTGGCAVGYQAAGYDVFALAYLIAVYGAVRAGHRRFTVVTSVVMLVLLPLAAMGTGMPAGEAFTRSRNVLELAWLIAAGAAGEALRQAERRATQAEQTREQSALRRAGEERLHIARELHDTLTHQISVIKVQAEAAVHLAHKRGEPVPEALLVIRDAGREAARELRETLGTLRGADDTRAHGLGQLPGLVRRAQSTGLSATLTVDGPSTDVPEAVDRTAYRIVQESLTNIARHAAADSASIRVEYRPGALVVQIDDDGRATPGITIEPGTGLLGMRERVTALGGRLDARPRDDGGFRVRAELPMKARS
ncbi:sensor histidine kinase [Actinoplanes sp. NPDC023714]|uniref:sensor histidine kinase n=1 Tax=Actinoplanes sp. NPDC023714 TaxID=3154322 RepID=UPI003407F23D